MMEKPQWIFGNEDRFYDFISKMSAEDSTLVSHTDLDGIGSAKVVHEAIGGAKRVYFVSYNQLNEELTDKIKKDNVNRVIFTDLFFKDRKVIDEIAKFADVLIIDHHTPETDYNSERVVFMNAQHFSAAYLCYYLFSKVRSFDTLDWLVACTSISDFAYRRNGRFMSRVFEKYGDTFIVNDEGNLRQSGAFWDIQWKISLALVYYADDLNKVFDGIGKRFEDIGKLKKQIDEVQREYDLLLGKFEKENVAMHNGRYWEFSSRFKLGSILSNELSNREKDKIFTLVSFEGKNCKFSARRQDGKTDLNEFCKNLVKGAKDGSAGGHRKAAGGFFPLDYLGEFKRRLGIIA